MIKTADYQWVFNRFRYLGWFYDLAKSIDDVLPYNQLPENFFSTTPLADTQSSLPFVFLTDRELAAMKAIELIFPESRHQLCSWHIDRNIGAEVKPTAKSYCDSIGTPWREHSVQFMSVWVELRESRSETEYETNFASFIDTYTIHQKESAPCVQYILSTWISLFAKKFVTCYNSNHRNFRQKATSRSESNHNASMSIRKGLFPTFASKLIIT